MTITVQESGTGWDVCVDGAPFAHVEQLGDTALALEVRAAATPDAPTLVAVQIRVPAPEEPAP